MVVYDYVYNLKNELVNNWDKIFLPNKNVLNATFICYEMYTFDF